MKNLTMFILGFITKVMIIESVDLYDRHQFNVATVKVHKKEYTQQDRRRHMIESQNEVLNLLNIQPRLVTCIQVERNEECKLTFLRRFDVLDEYLRGNK